MILASPVYFSVTTILGGSAAFSVKVPGTYGGLQPTDPTAGRYFKQARCWSTAPEDGDILTGLKLTDTDGVLATAERALCPNYPDVSYFYDPQVDGQTLKTGLLLNGETMIDAFNPAGNAPLLLPSGLYIAGTFTSGGLTVGATFRVNIIWGRFVPP